MSQPLNQKIEIPINLIGFPLSLKSNFLTWLSALPFALLQYFLNDTWLGEGYLWIPAILTFVYLRIKLSSVEHPDPKPIVFENDVFVFPKDLFRDKQERSIRADEIQEIVSFKISGTRVLVPLAKRRSWSLLLVLKNQSKIFLSGFATDLKALEDVLMQKGVSQKIAIARWCVWTAILLVIVATVAIYFLWNSMNHS